MTPLDRKIRRLIEIQGPLSVTDFMTACLYDPDHGYYTTRVPIGVNGDFTTAPEISQMFGELVGIWLYMTWRASGAPSRFTLCETGPGRGTMMADIVRTLAQIDRTMLATADIVLVETSPRLVREQQGRLSIYDVAMRWVDSVEALAHQPLFLAGNEIFDALPLRQYAKAAGHWQERLVGVGPDGNLTFVIGPGSLDPLLLPHGAAYRDDGTIFEIAPRREALMGAVANRIARDGGAALFFDYGHVEPGFGDTFQALRKHRPSDPFRDCGKADLTSHVDFAALARVAQEAGLAARMAGQGSFLLSMGIAERAGILGTGKAVGEQDALAAAVERLCGDPGMGTLFKVIAVHPVSLPVPGFDQGGQHAVPAH